MPNGIPHPGMAGKWLVPPWPAGAGFTDVVAHFLRFEPWDRSNAAHLSAYYLGYQAALDAVPDDESADLVSWCRSMRRLVARCAAPYQGKRLSPGRASRA